MNSLPVIGGPLDGTEHYYRTNVPRYLTEAGETLNTVKGDRMAWLTQTDPRRARCAGYVRMRVTGVDAYVHTSILRNYVSRGES